MFASFERLIDPYPEDAAPPPSRLGAFYWSFIRPVWGVLLAVSLLSALISVAEVTVFGFMGKLVDWLTKSNPATFLHDNGPKLWVMTERACA